jgi:hypothetical protein
MGSTTEQVHEVSTLSVIVPVPLRQALEELAAEEQRTLSGQVRVALCEHIAQHLEAAS